MINKLGGGKDFVIEKDYIFFLWSNNKSYITITDGDKIINKIEMETPHNNIYTHSNNNIYFINYRTNKIVSIDKEYKVKRILNIHNNGRIKVDSEYEKIYICDTEDVSIYGLENGEKLGAISGFSAANCVELDATKKCFLYWIY